MQVNASFSPFDCQNTTNVPVHVHCNFINFRRNILKQNMKCIFRVLNNLYNKTILLDLVFG